MFLEVLTFPNSIEFKMIYFLVFQLKLYDLQCSRITVDSISLTSRGIQIRTLKVVTNLDGISALIVS